jgi:hypothetical protein
MFGGTFMRSRHSFLVAVLLGGIIAGTIDVFAASAINGFVDPLRILRFIAGGLIGLPAARAAGLNASALGYGLQVGMSVLIAAIYNLGAMILPVLRRHWLPAGLAFGIGVFLVMTYVVVPLSAIGGGMPPFTQKQAMNLVAMLVFGTIIAWFARAAKT